MTNFQLTPENYHSQEANLHYFSNSQFKGFKQCEFKQMAKIKGELVENESATLLLGKYVHKASENGKHVEYLNDNFVSFADCGLLSKKNGNPNKALREADEKVIPVMETDNIIKTALQGEKEVIMTSELFGVNWKIMLDSYNRPDGYFSDLKYMKDLGRVWNDQEKVYQSFLEFYGYYMQIALYMYIEKEWSNSLTYLKPNLVIITKEKTPKRTIINGFDENFMNEKLFEGPNSFAEGIERMKGLKAGKIEPRQCGECDWCKEHETTPIKKWWELVDY